MKLVSFRNASGQERLGLYLAAGIVDLAQAGQRMGLSLPRTMLDYLRGGPELAKEVARAALALEREPVGMVDPASIAPLAPVPHPVSVRDAYAFRQHVETARRNRNLEMIPEFDRFPVFYFTNHLAIVGEGEVAVERDHLPQLDFELEVAVVIGKPGKNIRAAEAEAHIAGFMVMNDLSARLLQADEMKLNLGPAKGKDFATALGPWLVTPDELESKRSASPNGSRWSLEMRAFHNGRLVSQGNLADMNWTFGEIIERASYGVQLYPGEVIGSGTVGTGCYLELNGTGARLAAAEGRQFSPSWLAPGDTIELEVEGLGRLANRIARAPEERSILDRRPRG